MLVTFKKFNLLDFLSRNLYYQKIVMFQDKYLDFFYDNLSWAKPDHILELSLFFFFPFKMVILLKSPLLFKIFWKSSSLNFLKSNFLQRNYLIIIKEIFKEPICIAKFQSLINSFLQKIFGSVGEYCNFFIK